MEASCWVARKIFLSDASASSRARTLDSRPTTNGVIMYGKMTTSRMGIIGSRLVSNFSFPWLNFHLWSSRLKNCDKKYRTLAGLVPLLYLPELISAGPGLQRHISHKFMVTTGCYRLPSKAKASARVCGMTSEEIAESCRERYLPRAESSKSESATRACKRFHGP